jgi:alkylation response protein AidB-like acyl-CoA dehydrogenase
MDFDFSPEQYMFQESLRTFLMERFDGAKVWELDERDRRSDQLWHGLCDLGILSMLVPEAYGGLGLSLVDLALPMEEFGRALAPSSVAETITATDLLVQHATEEQKARLLPQIAQGGLTVSTALLETQADFSPESMSLAAIASGNRWSVSGTKILAPHAEQADLILVALRFGDSGSLGLAAIEPSRPGLSFRAHTNLDVVNQYYEVTFDDTPLVRDDIIGGEPIPDSVWRLFNVGGLISASQMSGIAAKVLDASIAYARQRNQFGRPIGSFQAIKHRCADMTVSIDASRSAAYYAAWALSDRSCDAPRAVSIAKSYCGDTARYVCNESIQIHGGVGFTWELGLHYYLRRAKTLEYLYGDASYHRERVLAMSLAQLDAEGVD